MVRESQHHDEIDINNERTQEHQQSRSMEQGLMHIVSWTAWECTREKSRTPQSTTISKQATVTHGCHKHTTHLRRIRPEQGSHTRVHNLETQVPFSSTANSGWIPVQQRMRARQPPASTDSATCQRERVESSQPSRHRSVSCSHETKMKSMQRGAMSSELSKLSVLKTEPRTTHTDRHQDLSEEAKQTHEPPLKQQRYQIGFVKDERKSQLERTTNADNPDGGLGRRAEKPGSSKALGIPKEIQRKRTGIPSNPFKNPFNSWHLKKNTATCEPLPVVAAPCMAAISQSTPADRNARKCKQANICQTLHSDDVNTENTHAPPLRNK